MTISPFLEKIHVLRKKLLLFLAVVLFSATGATAQLSGTYTINSNGSGSTNYTTFTAAVTALTTSGVNGPVTFNVSDGTYSEQISIGAITGASNTNRITFQSASGDSSKVILTTASSSTTASNYTLQLNGADFLTFKKLTISRPGILANARVVTIEAGANNNQFLNNQIISSVNTSTNSAGFYSTGSLDNDNEFRNNYIKYGYYSFYYYGSSTNVKKNTVIENNILDSFTYAMYLSYNENITVNRNRFINNRGTTFYGIYNQNGSGGSQFIGNYLHARGTTAYAIYHTASAGTSTAPQITANNMVVTENTGTTMGIYLNNVSYNKVVYNSINVTAGSATAGRAFYATASSTAKTGNHVYNNIFANTGGGYAYEITTGGVTYTAVDSSNHNNLYATGTYLAALGTSDLATLSDWKTASGFDANSVSVDPKFVSPTNLHTKAILLNAAAKPLSYVTTDYDGQLRNTSTPDIGADEFNPPTDDAGISAFVSPAKGSCAGTKDVIVKLRNYGLDTLKSVTITYLLNGVQQTSTVYNVSLASAQETNITVGTVAINTTAKNILVYTSNPNTNSDPTNTNDTVKATVAQGLGGTYTIGGTGANYSSFTAAANALDQFGACSAVTFNVANGTYTEAVVINEVAGASNTNRITFQSASGDSSKVVLTNPSSTALANNYTLYLNGADFITLKKLTIQRSGTDNYGRVIELSGGAHNNQIMNNRIISSMGTTTNSAGINSVGDIDTNNTIMNNMFKYGYYGINLSGASTSNTEPGNVIHGNIIDSSYYYGIRFEAQHSGTVTSNSVTNLRHTLNYGIYIYYNTGTSTKRGLIANNMFSVGGTSTSYGINLYYSSFQDVVYNNVLNTGTSATASIAFYSTSGSTGYSENRIYNNNFVKIGGFTAVEVTTGGITSISKMDNNNIYSTGTTLAAYGTTDYTTLSAWQTASGWDAKSVSVDPLYVSNTNLHVSNPALNGKAMTFSGVTIDYDKEIRNTTTPDIGADEFTPPANEVAVLEIISPKNNICGDSSTFIGVVVKNFGTSSQSNFGLTAKVTGSLTSTLTGTYNKTLTSLGTDTFYFNTPINTYSGGNYNIQVYSTLSTDQKKSNDTVQKVIPINAIPAAPTVTNAARCGKGSVTLNASGAPGTNVKWFTSPTASVPVSTGGNFNTPVLSNTTTYFAEVSPSVSYLVGPADTTIGTSGSFSSFSAQSLLFEAFQTFTLDSVTVFSTSAGNVVVRLLDQQTNQAIGTATAYVSKAGPSRIAVGMVITPGTYKLDALGSTVSGLQRNNAGASYPYTAGGVVSITGSSFNANSYYYFYNWKVSTLGCPSPRVPVKATINPIPSGAAIAKGNVFEGNFNNGTSNDPDAVCAGNSISYEMVPPTGFSNSGFGTTWAITALTFKTIGGTLAQDTFLTFPTATSNGKLLFKPKTSLSDSTFIMTVTIANMQTGCDTTIMRYVYVAPVPNADFSATSVCEGKLVSFFNNATGGGTLSYLYRFGDGNTSSSATPLHMYASAGTYQVTQIVTNTNGCIDSITKTVAVNALPQASFTAANVCNDSAITFINTSTVANGTLTYLWDFLDGNTSTDANPTHTFAGAGTYDVKLVATSNNGCKDSVMIAVTVYPEPVAAFTSSDVCNGQSASFSNMSTVSNGTLTYAWNFGDGNTSMAENPTHLYAAEGTYNVTLVVTSNNGCTDTVSQNININTKPNAAFTASNVCLGAAAMFMNTSTDSGTAANYNWNFGDGNSSMDENATHTYSAAGTYSVRLIVNTAAGCADTFTRSITVYENPVAEFTAQNACAGSEVSFRNQSNTLGDTAARYLWSFGNGDTSTSANPTYTYTLTGTYKAVLATMNGNMCIDTVSRMVTIYELPTAKFGATEVCVGNATTFSDSTTPVGTIVSYIWYFGDGDTSTMSNPQHTYGQAGNYTASLVVRTTSGCNDSVAQTVVVNALPDAGFTFTTNEKTATFTPNQSNLTTYSWNFGNGKTSGDVSPVHQYDSNGTYVVTLTVTNAGGCTQMFSDSVVINSVGIGNVSVPQFNLNVFPNPFRENFNLVYELEKSSRINVAVYDITGKQILTVIDAQQGAGKHTHNIDGNANNMKAGTYFIRINVDGKLITNKIIRVK